MSFKEKGFNREKKPVNGAEDLKAAAAPKKTQDSQEKNAKESEMDSPARVSRRDFLKLTAGSGVACARDSTHEEPVQEDSVRKESIQEESNQKEIIQEGLTHKELVEMFPTHEKNIEREIGMIDAVLGRAFNMKKIRKGIGPHPMKFFKNVSEDASFVMHLGQVHSETENQFKQHEGLRAYISQYVVSNMLKNFVDYNETGKPFPAVFEHQITTDTPEKYEGNQEEKIKSYLRYAITRYYNFWGTGKVFFADKDTDSEYLKPFLENGIFYSCVDLKKSFSSREAVRRGFESSSNVPVKDVNNLREEAESLMSNYPVSIPREELFNLHDPLLDLIIYLDPSGKAKELIPDSPDSPAFPLLRSFSASNPEMAKRSLFNEKIIFRSPVFRLSYIDNIVEQLYSAVKKINAGKKARIIIGDSVVKKGEKEIRARKGAALFNERREVNKEEMDNIVHAQKLLNPDREKIAVDEAVNAGAHTGGIVLGGAHDLRNQTENRNVDLVYIPTDPDRIRDGSAMPYPYSELFNRNVANANPELKKSAIVAWIKKRGTRSDLLNTFKECRYCDHLFSNIRYFQEIIREVHGQEFTSEELFSIIEKSFVSESHHHGHIDFHGYRYIPSPENFERYLSDEHFKKLEGMWSWECGEHPE